MGINETRAMMAKRTGVAVDDKGKVMNKKAQALAAATPVKKAFPKRISQQSKKQRKTSRKLAKDYGPFLEKHPICGIQSPICTQVATCANHDKGRGVNEVHDQRFWTPACSPCNGFIEANHAWAKARGFKLSRHQKESPK